MNGRGGARRSYLRAVTGKYRLARFTNHFESKSTADILRTDSAVRIAPGAFSFFCVVLLCALRFASVVCADDSSLRGSFDPAGQDARGVESGSSQAFSSNSNAEKPSAKKEDKTSDPFRRDRNGVQTYFPAVAKIVGRSGTKTNVDGVQTTPYYYGTGSLVAEYNAWGIVVTNWHVVSEATESIDVYFPSGVYSARVVLRDDIWDLAALIIARPVDITPLPISSEAPRLGDVFWVGGYGQSNGLADFQMGRGKLTNYVSLVDPDGVFDDKVDDEDDSGVAEKLLDEKRAEKLAKLIPSPLYETASIKHGVRQGDSGGPIFNRYGELAGILWGSDGQCTMGTTGVRLRAFLTQAIRRAAEIYAENLLDSEETGVSPVSILPWKEAPSACAVAENSDLEMREALKRAGVFPVSKKALYFPAGGENPEDFTRLGRKAAIEKVERASLEYLRANEYAAPPSPPIFSPTFVVMQEDLKRARPEVADDDAFDALDAYSLAEAKKRRDEAEFRNSRALWALVDENAPRAEIATTARVVDDESLALGLDEKDPTRPRILPVSDSVPKDAEIESDQVGDEIAAVENEEALQEPRVSDGSARNEGETEVAPQNGGSPFDVLQVYVVVLMIFVIFFYSVRLLNGSSDSNSREKRGKTRLQGEK